MALLHKTYGKARVRIMRIERGTYRHEVRELTIQAMVEGDFDSAFNAADNATSVATDTIKNLVNVVARENVTAGTEAFCQILARRLLDEYPMLTTARVTGLETRWTRMVIDGQPHPHGFLLDPNGKPFAKVTATREGQTIESGVSGFTFMKATESGWVNYVQDRYTTLPETTDRIAATSMDASWLWRSAPVDHARANAAIMETMLRVFVTTYSHSIQDSLYRMGSAALESVPELESVTLACPNKHYIPINLAPFGLSADNLVFTPTDEPHGQIECTIGRDA